MVKWLDPEAVVSCWCGHHIHLATVPAERGAQVSGCCTPQPATTLLLLRPPSALIQHLQHTPSCVQRTTPCLRRTTARILRTTTTVRRQRCAASDGLWRTAPDRLRRTPSPYRIRCTSALWVWAAPARTHRPAARIPRAPARVAPPPATTLGRVRRQWCWCWRPAGVPPPGHERPAPTQ